jgi:hypothetical protein
MIKIKDIDFSNKDVEELYKQLHAVYTLAMNTGGTITIPRDILDEIAAALKEDREVPSDAHSSLLSDDLIANGAELTNGIEAPETDEFREWKLYRKSGLVEMKLYNSTDDMSEISISSHDLLNGSPKPGDMIARDPYNHDDKWLVSQKYFKENYESFK